MKHVEQSVDSSTPTMVYRPRRRCPECGLVNADRARRCKRCRRSFADIDPMLESELLVSRLRLKRFAAIAAVGLALISILVTAYGLHARGVVRAQYSERIRALSVDIKSIDRGVRSDAEALVGAFDDAEAASILEEQAGAWSERARKCARLHNELTTLVPTNPDQTQKQMELDKLLSTLSSVSRDISRSALESNVSSARETARSVAPSAKRDGAR